MSFLFLFDNRPSYQGGVFRRKMLYLNKSASSNIFSFKKIKTGKNMKCNNLLED